MTALIVEGDHPLDRQPRTLGNRRVNRHLMVEYGMLGNLKNKKTGQRTPLYTVYTLKPYSGRALKGKIPGRQGRLISPPLFLENHASTQQTAFDRSVKELQLLNKDASGQY